MPQSAQKKYFRTLPHVFFKREGKIYRKFHDTKFGIQAAASGFTLIEAVLVIAILSVLILAVLTSINPTLQFQKTNDAVRKQDLEHIQTALDMYYHDTNCYPQSVPFGSKWEVGNVVYMEKVPQDPDCASTGWCYQYQTDTTNSCPQWNALYAHLEVPPHNYVTTCPILNACGYMQTKYSYCVFSGSLDCTYIKANPLGVPTPTPTPGPAPTATPTPLPGGGCSCATAQFNWNGGQPNATNTNCNLVPLGNGAYCDRSCSVACTP